MMSHEIYRRTPMSRSALVVAFAVVILVTGAFAFAAGVEAQRGQYEGDRKVTVNTSVFPNTDCRVWVGVHDMDGKPGGRKVTEVSAPECP